jgi:hypothetical protein
MQGARGRRCGQMRAVTVRRGRYYEPASESVRAETKSCQSVRCAGLWPGALAAVRVSSFQPSRAPRWAQRVGIWAAWLAGTRRRGARHGERIAACVHGQEAARASRNGDTNTPRPDPTGRHQSHSQETPQHHRGREINHCQPVTGSTTRSTPTPGTQPPCSAPITRYRLLARPNSSLCLGFHS